MWLWFGMQLALADQCACEGGSWVDEYELQPCDASVEDCTCTCDTEDGSLVCEKDGGAIPEGTSCEWVDEYCSGTLDCTDDVIWGDEEKGCATVGASLGAWGAITSLWATAGRRRRGHS